MDTLEQKTGILTRIVEVFLRGDVAILLTVISLILGGVALVLTPREEEPQIVVPMADVFVSAPGLSAEDMERKVTVRVEKLLYQIDGVEYVYSMSKAGHAIVTVRFYVGENREDSLVKLRNKIESNTDQIPPSVRSWVVKPVEVDDVPIVNVTMWTDRTDLYGDYELRRLAEEIQNELQAIRDTNRIAVVGGRPRRIRVELDPVRLAAHHTSALQVAQAMQVSNVHVNSGTFNQQDEAFIVDSGTFFRDAQDLQDVVVNVSSGRLVYLKDVATVTDGPEEVESYSWIGFGPAAQNPKASKDHAATSAGADQTSDAPAVGQLFPAVHIAVAKRKGSNAVWVAEAVEQRMRELSRTHFPSSVYFRITRDYGETADEKVNELVESLVIAVLTVIGLIGLTIGWRAALVVALAIPVCYSITLFINLLAGYTINRVTLFALILALGLLVDDPITDVENIARYFAMRILPPRESVLRAIQEVRPALILSTLAIIASFLPLAFITGMMGPYMGPMALNVPLTVTVSTVVAFVITPWLAMVALRKLHDSPSSEEPFDLKKRPAYRIARFVLEPILTHRSLCFLALLGVALLLAGAMILPALRLVPLKMLPFDNKNEFQIVVDMPENTTLQQTDAFTRQLAHYLAGVPEVVDYQLYVGLASPMDFNGMVRHYFLRQGPHVADLRVNLAPKDNRAQQSHTLLLRIRDDLTRIARQSALPATEAAFRDELEDLDETTVGQLLDVAKIASEERADRLPSQLLAQHLVDQRDFEARGWMQGLGQHLTPDATERLWLTYKMAGANIKLVEVPPGPPVISSITAEVYGPPDATYDQVIAAARHVEDRMRREPGVVDVDMSAEADERRYVFVTDKPKAALSGVSTQTVADTLQLALGGHKATVMQRPPVSIEPPSDVNPLWVQLRLPRAIRSSTDDLAGLYVQGDQGQLVQLSELGSFVDTLPDGSRLLNDKTIYRKNLQRVVYVFAEMAGRPPADAIIDMLLDQEADGTRPKPAAAIRPANERTWISPGGDDPWAMPSGYEVRWAGEGEWKITLDVFRDLGLAFAAAQVGIFVILMFQTGSRLLPLVIMLAIPLTMIGIMPGFWLLNVLVSVPTGGYPDPVLLTATAMIGMIALSGIVVRNSVVLVDFIHHAEADGVPLREAVIQSVAVRTRPILATAGTTLLGNWVITLDPIFSGLAWAIIFGILTSTVFTLVVIPVVYWVLYGDRDKSIEAEATAN